MVVVFSEDSIVFKVGAGSQKETHHQIGVIEEKGLSEKREMKDKNEERKKA